MTIICKWKIVKNTQIVLLQILLLSVESVEKILKVNLYIKVTGSVCVPLNHNGCPLQCSFSLVLRRFKTTLEEVTTDLPREIAPKKSTNLSF